MRLPLKLALMGNTSKAMHKENVNEPRNKNTRVGTKEEKAMEGNAIAEEMK